MTTFVLRLYDYLHRNRWLCYVLLAAIVVGSVLLTLRLRFNEDISDFLPNDEAYQKSMSIYRQINAADRIFVVFQLRDSSQTDTEKLISAVELFGKQTAGEHWKMTAQVDYDKLINIASFVYRNAPLFLTAADYKRMERQLAPDSITSALQRAQEQLLFPTGSLVSNNIQRDPLGLFTPLITRLQTANSNIRYALNDGFIFTPDNKRAIIMIDSPYGSSETSKNSTLINRVNTAASAVEQAIPGVQIQATGAPVIAVQNARQIKTDSLWAVSIAAVLILSLLFYALRSLRKMLFIVVSLAFGWLIAMAGMSVLHQHVSVIVLGIASIIIGIAVNYPLHFVSHLSHQPSPRAVLQDIAEPLVIGNITTVGAFCALIPLDSTALRDLGIFAALMLMGTILFVMVFLPHLCKQNAVQKVVGQLQEETNETAEYTPTYPRNKWVAGSLIVITLVLGYFSLSTSFDTNMQNINYLDPNQRELLAGLSKMRNATPGETQLYIASEGATVDEALTRSEQDSADVFITSRREQQRRIDRWNAFVHRHHAEFYIHLPQTAARIGFSTEAFTDFYSLLNTPFHPQDIRFFAPLTANGIGTRIIGRTAVRVTNVPTAVADSLITAYADQNNGRWAFDVQSMNSTIAVSLSDNFNYIGWACGLIVFVFLWLSFGKIEHALVAFLPMAVSWIWILGTMHLFGMRFNLVNVILATFIFGQGDDYSIFITEGLIYERTHHRRMLASYTRSILLSAAIMFIGMGTLIVARHPALHSLGEITIVGMASVVAMTYVLPPIVFGWLYTRSDGSDRPFPVTVRRLAATSFAAMVYLGQIFYGLCLSTYLFKIRRKTPARVRTLHNRMYRFFKFDIHRISGVKTTILNPDNEDFERPGIIICNHQSILDPVCLMALSPKIVIITGKKVWHNPVVHRILKFADFLSIEQGADVLLTQCRQRIAEGYSIAIFPEGERPLTDGIGRFHNGAFLLAQQLNVDLIPVYLYGLRTIMPRGSMLCDRGDITVKIGRRITIAEQKTMGCTALALKKEVYRRFVAEYFSN